MQHVDNILMVREDCQYVPGPISLELSGAVGSPGFDKDEACAQVGIDKIKDLLR